MISFRKLGFMVLAIVCLLVFASTGMCQEKVVVADAPTTHHIALYMGIDLGIFKKHGLNVEYIAVKSLGSAKDAVAAGSADIFMACPTFTMTAISGGAPIKIIAQGKVPCTSVLVVSAASPIQKISDLNGKKVAGISPTCEAVIAFEKAVKDVGGTYELVKLAPAPAMSALEAGVVDAAILEEPFASVMELKGYKLLFREIVDVPCRMIAANVNFISQKTETAKKFVAAMEEANQLFTADSQTDQIVNIAVKYTAADAAAIKHGNPRIHLTTKRDTVRNDALVGYLVGLGAIPKALTDDEMYASQFKGITW